MKLSWPRILACAAKLASQDFLRLCQPFLRLPSATGLRGISLNNSKMGCSFLSFIGFGEKFRLRNSEIEVFGKLIAGSDARDKVNAN
jgi:hypothetical protein